MPEQRVGLTKSAGKTEISCPKKIKDDAPEVVSMYRHIPHIPLTRVLLSDEIQVCSDAQNTGSAQGDLVDSTKAVRKRFTVAW